MNISSLDSDKNVMQLVKQRFFAMRNGVVADTLRQAGCSYKIIFGLNLPQLREIAGVFGFNRELAYDLWANTSTRESRLLAPMFIDASAFTFDDALEFVSGDFYSAEEIDLLCHSLLRKTSFVNRLIEIFGDSHRPELRYLALRLAFGRVSENPELAWSLSSRELERADAFTSTIARQLSAEAAYWLAEHENV